MKPAPQGTTDPERAGLAGQQEERGLKSIVGVVGVDENAAADRHDHRPVALDQGLESQLVAMR